MKYSMNISGNLLKNITDCKAQSEKRSLNSIKRVENIADKYIQRLRKQIEVKKSRIFNKEDMNRAIENKLNGKL